MSDMDELVDCECCKGEGRVLCARDKVCVSPSPIGDDREECKCCEGKKKVTKEHNDIHRGL